MAKKVKPENTFEWRISHIPQILKWVENQDVERLNQFLVQSPNTPLYCFTGPLVMLEILWGLLGTVLMIFCVIEPFHLEGWLYNLLFQ